MILNSWWEVSFGFSFLSLPSQTIQEFCELQVAAGCVCLLSACLELIFALICLKWFAFCAAGSDIQECGLSSPSVAFYVLCFGLSSLGLYKVVTKCWEQPRFATYFSGTENSSPCSRTIFCHQTTPAHTHQKQLLNNEVQEAEVLQQEFHSPGSVCASQADFLRVLSLPFPALSLFLMIGKISSVLSLLSCSLLVLLCLLSTPEQ